MEVYTERRRRQAQTDSVIAYAQISLLAQSMNGKTQAVEEVFPFWTGEEKRQLARMRMQANVDRMMTELLANSDAPESIKKGGSTYG